MPEIRKPKLRIFAGPNGSGKSSLFEQFCKMFRPGPFINADDIEKELKKSGEIDLSKFELTLTSDDLTSFLSEASAASFIETAKGKSTLIDLEIKDNKVFDKGQNINSYHGALIAMLIRKHISDKCVDYSFETVMSHPSKLNEIQENRRKGYKIYLYFICTIDPKINTSRVGNRVAKGGHNVKAEAIINRYTKTLELLFLAITLVDQFFLFDNSGEELMMIASGNQSKIDILMDNGSLPNWFNDYVINRIGH